MLGTLMGTMGTTGRTVSCSGNSFTPNESIGAPGMSPFKRLKTIMLGEAGEKDLQIDSLVKPKVSKVQPSRSDRYEVQSTD